MYLVTGGKDGAYLSSTEILARGGNSWSFVGELPRAMFGVQAVSIGNTIIVTGNIISQ